MFLALIDYSKIPAWSRTGNPRHGVYAEKVAFQQKIRLSRAQKVAFELKDQITKVTQRGTVSPDQ
jgi:hypothetical protein